MRGAIKNNAILDRWRETLAARGSGAANAANAAIVSPEGVVERTFADIEREAGEWVERLGSWQAGTVLGMQVGNVPGFPALVLAAMRVGLVPLPLGRHMAREERETALETCGAGVLATEEGIEERPGRNAPEGCDLLKLTSGTTSRPRAIRFTAAQLAADCDNICETMGFGGGDLNYGVIPFSHSYGFSNLITPLLCRGVPLVASEERMPRAILAGLARTGATVFPGMPVFFEKLADIAGPLDDLRLCISAGAPLPRRVGEAFAARFSRKVHTFYGSSECGGIAYDAGDEPVCEEGYVGQPMRNVEVTPLGASGQVAVRSAAVGEGYYPEPEPEALGGGRFVPADLVRLGPRGLYLAGRAGDVINIAGRKLNPTEVEARLARCPGVRQVVVFGIASALRNEEAVACVSGSAKADEILRYARAVLSGWQVPKDVWLVDEVPVNERGKLSRRELAKAYAGIRK
ncbi:MAG: class I adenylate-forming enzyme family protein [Chthoniobacteraceae bacterium]|jgi:acyl-CoA synthetase (AMP-forming)/AMP-acid ligase II